jgi:hypothetical protein
MAVRIHIAWKIAALAGALAFLILVWPTAYRYDRIAVGAESLPVRINRLTGSTEILRVEGWRPVPRYGNQESLPASALTKLRIEQGEWSSHELSFQLYNGSGYSISSIVVEVQLYPAPPENPKSGFDPRKYGAKIVGGAACEKPYAPIGVKLDLERSYRFSADVQPKSFSDHSFRTDLGVEVGDDAVACSISYARGREMR